MTTAKADSPHLWEMDHPYYCNESNYFSNECHVEYGSWEAFVYAEGDADDDMNLLFRWDWFGPGSEDNSDTEDRLLLCYVGQRKGLFRTVTVFVKRANEPAVRAWLRGRFEHLLKLWTPISGDGVRHEIPEELTEPEVAEEQEDLLGECVSCGSDDVRVTRYPGRRNSDLYEFFCELCAGSNISASHAYPGQTDGAALARAIGYATNTILKAIEAAKEPE